MTSRAQTILGVNTNFGSLKYKGLTECRFGSNASFLDYDAVVIETSSLARQFDRGFSDPFNGKLCLSQNESFQMKNAFVQTKAQIIEVLKQGKTVFILLANNENCYVHTGHQDFSGTGKNARTTNFVEPFDVFSFLPIPFRATMVIGKKYDIVCQPPYSSFFQKTQDLFYYDAYFTATKKSTLLMIPKSDKAISAVYEYGTGKIVVLPRPYARENYKTEDGWKEYGKVYLDALFELNHALRSGTEEFVLPSWTNGIKLPNEQAEETRLVQEETKLRSIEAAIQKRKEQIQRIRRKKMLLAASGTPLEEAVKETLQGIGFSLYEAEPGRSDVIASYDGVDVVAEIKGVSKSAAEKHASQLEKWVSQFIGENEQKPKPKAILIVNGYCDTPLSERTEEVFPDQMLEYSTA